MLFLVGRNGNGFGFAKSKCGQLVGAPLIGFNPFAALNVMLCVVDRLLDVVRAVKASVSRTYEINGSLDIIVGKRVLIFVHAEVFDLVRIQMILKPFSSFLHQLTPVTFSIGEGMVVNLLASSGKPELHNDVYAAELLGSLSDENKVSGLLIVKALLLNDFPVSIVLVQSVAKLLQRLELWLRIISVIKPDFNVSVSLAIFVGIMNA